MTEFCCSMRKKFIVGIIAEDSRVPTPTDMVDCIVKWEPVIVLRIRFCPFCGKPIDPREPTRTILTPKAGIDQ